MPAKKPQGEYVREKQRTEEAVARAMADIHRSAVVFTERTLTYMEALGLPAEDMAALRDWNGVLYPKGCHRSREAAIILNAAPQLWNIILHTITPREHRKGDGKARIQTIPLRMWRDFWSDAAPGDTFRALARRVMTHAFAEAETRTPDIVDVAASWHPLPNLSDIEMAAYELSTYSAMAHSGGMEVGKTPLDLEGKLRNRQVMYMPDIRELQLPDTLAEDSLWYGRDWLVCATCRRAMTESAVGMREIATPAGTVHLWSNYQGPENGVLWRAYCRMCSPVLWRNYEAAQNLPKPRSYTSLDMIKHRSIGQHPEETPDVNAALAYLYGMTAEQVRAMLARAPVEPAPLAQCPLADRCDTFCGEMQREGHPKPRTHDGRWQSCDYATFLQGDHVAAAASLQPKASAQEEVELAVQIYEQVEATGGVQAGLF